MTNEPKNRRARAILVAALTVVTVMVGASCSTSGAIERATDGAISREVVESAGDAAGVTDALAGSEIDRAASDVIDEAAAE